MTPEKALEKLKIGNGLFARDIADHPVERKADLDSQSPMATVLSCSDSRVPVESIFGRGIGGVFVIRCAGNLARGSAILGSLEYGTLVLNTPVLVVLGHQRCGAVGAAVQGTVKVEGAVRIESLVEEMAPPLARAKSRGLVGTDLWDAVVMENVWHSIEEIFHRCPGIAARVEKGVLKVLGAQYSLESGVVEWLGEHPRQNEWISSGGAA